jgi:hypothetical protein
MDLACLPACLPACPTDRPRHGKTTVRWHHPQTKRCMLATCAADARPIDAQWVTKSFGVFCSLLEHLGFFRLSLPSFHYFLFFLFFLQNFKTQFLGCLLRVVHCPMQPGWHQFKNASGKRIATVQQGCQIPKRQLYCGPALINWSCVSV